MTKKYLPKKINIYKKLFFLLVVISLSSLAHPALALETIFPVIPGFPNLNVTANQTLPNFINYFFGFAMITAGVAGVFSIVYAGIRILIAGGNPSAISEARERIFGSITGIVLLMFSFVLLQTINPSLITVRIVRLTPSLAPGEYRIWHRTEPTGYNQGNPFGIDVAYAQTDTGDQSGDELDGDQEFEEEWVAALVDPIDDELDDAGYPAETDFLFVGNPGSDGTCKKKILWTHSVAGNPDYDPLTKIHIIPCQRLKEDLSNLKEMTVSFDGVESYQSDDEQAGVYLLDAPNCGCPAGQSNCDVMTSNMTRVITDDGNIDPDFVYTAQSALIINDKDTHYGFVLNVNPDNKGRCSDPYVNFNNVAGSNLTDSSICVSLLDETCVVTTPPPTDVCPNIAGTQTSIPAGMDIDGSGNCVATPSAQDTGSLMVTIVVINHGGNKTAANFPLTAYDLDDNEFEQPPPTSGTTLTVDVGSYQISETPDPNYIRTFSGNCSISGEVEVIANTLSSCTITNEEVITTPPPPPPPTGSATLTVNKVCNPTTDIGKFNLTIDGQIVGTGANVGCEGINAVDGATPIASLTFSGSKFYGTTLLGGSANKGTVFSVDANGENFQTLHSFLGGSDGSSPRSSLVLSGSTLYGTTQTGTIFSLNIDGTKFTKLYGFGMNATSLILSGSTLYGMTTNWGSADKGTIFSIQTNGTNFNILHHFTGVGGAYPDSPLILSGSTLYGTTPLGGNTNKGTVFSINTNGTNFVIIRNFTGGSTDGQGPANSLTLSGSTLYGTTPVGGSSNKGIIFSINTNSGAFDLIYSFEGGINDGQNPRAPITISGSTLYGITQYGGSYNKGTIFSIETDETDTKILHSFNQDANGGTINSAPLILFNSMLYGTTYFGGSANKGTLFSIQTSGENFGLIHDFTGQSGNNTTPIITTTGPVTVTAGVAHTISETAGTGTNLSNYTQAFSGACTGVQENGVLVGKVTLTAGATGICTITNTHN